MSGIHFKDYTAVTFSASGKLILSNNNDCEDIQFQVFAESFPDFVMQMVNLGVDIGRCSIFENPRVKFVILD